MSTVARVREERGVDVLTLDDGKVNVLTLPVLDAVLAELDVAEQDETARAVVLAGRPGVLSAGFDLGVMMGGSGRRELVTRGFEAQVRLLRFPKPVVVAVTGHAIAAGALLALAADARVAADGDFRIGLNEVAIGLPLPVAAHLLVRHRLPVPQQHGAIVGARMCSPREAVAAGWVDDVVPADQVTAVAVREAARQADLDPWAFRMTKTSANAELIERMPAALSRDIDAIEAVVAAARHR